MEIRYIRGDQKQSMFMKNMYFAQNIFTRTRLAHIFRSASLADVQIHQLYYYIHFFYDIKQVIFNQIEEFRIL